QDQNNTQIDNCESCYVQAGKKPVCLNRRLCIILKGFPHSAFFSFFLVESPYYPDSCDIFPKDHIHPVQESLQPVKNFRRFSGHNQSQYNNKNCHSNEQQSHLAVYG